VIVSAATTNPGKLAELAALLAPVLQIRPAPDDYTAPEETGRSYLENAHLKARALFGRTGAAALADDSGLEVAALGGAPGLHSARFGIDVESRIARLFTEIAGRDRRARFRTALVLVLANGREVAAEGDCEGEIVSTPPRGGGGFGYDPVFLVPSLGRTLAELTREEKNRVSARGVAARALLAALARYEAP
jgi:XTP/dITP diphosphohydrolase